jgi:hypothetical protein
MSPPPADTPSKLEQLDTEVRPDSSADVPAADVSTLAPEVKEESVEESLGVDDRSKEIVAAVASQGSILQNSISTENCCGRIFILLRQIKIHLKFLDENLFNNSGQTSRL